MFLLLFFAAFLAFGVKAASVFSPEQIVTAVIGTFVTYGFTNWIKTQTGLQGVGATILAFVVSFVVAMIGFVTASLLNGAPLSLDLIPNAGFQIFAIATFAYKLLMADVVPTDDEPTAPAPTV